MRRRWGGRGITRGRCIIRGGEEGGEVYDILELGAR